MKSPLTRSFRKLVSFAATTIARKYLQKDRWYHYDGLRLKVYKDVFHPGLFRSTKVFAAWIAQQDIKDKRVLEIGSGSGLLSLVAARNGAVVTAVDINPKAVANTKLNAAINQLDIRTLHSDLFVNVQKESFDMVLINPPYYPKKPQNDYEKAWYCGEDFDYFRKLFLQLNQRDHKEHCFLILSDTCDLPAIQTIANNHNIWLYEIERKNISGEQLIIYQATLTVPA